MPKSRRRQGYNRRKRQSGWHLEMLAKQRGDFSYDCAAYKPTRWDQFLEELGLSEDQAFEVVTVKGEPGSSLRRFVRRICLRRFVPEAVLCAMGMHEEVEQHSRWLSMRETGK